MSKELENQAEELEQTLQKQLDLLKKDSEDWVKVGGAVVAGGLLAYAIVKLAKGKKTKKNLKALEVLEREGLLTEELEKKITQPKKSTFWPSLSQRLLILGLALAKEKYFKDLFTSPKSDEEQKESHR